MICKLTDQVWFGNWEAPFECIGEVGTIINVAHHFNPGRGRNAYFAKLESLPWDVYYTRLALKDRHDVTPVYCDALRSVVLHARDLGKLPILTHCQMGGHRGPSSGIAAAYFLSDGKPDTLKALHDRTIELCPGLLRGRNYYRTLMHLLSKAASA